MRRFELSGNTNHKFWEIEIIGAKVITRWGRIGTRGQTKTKDHDSPGAAVQDAAKLITAKVKKGYSEIAIEPTDHPVAEALPVPKPMSKDVADQERPKSKAETGEISVTSSVEEVQPSDLPDENTFTLPDPWQAEIHPYRGDRFISPTHLSLEEQLVTLAEVAKAHKIQLPVESRPESWTEDIFFDLEKQLFDGLHGSGRGVVALIHIAMKTKGLVMALKVLRAQVRFEVPSSFCPGLRDLRIVLAQCSDEDYRTAKAFLDQDRLASYLSAAHCAYLATSEESWLQDAVRLSTDGSVRRLLLCCPSTIERVREIFMEPWGNEGVAETLAVKFGAEAAPFLGEWLSLKSDADVDKQLVNVLLEIPADEAVSALFDCIGQKVVQHSLPTLFKRYPQRCLRLGAQRKEMHPYVTRWLFENPDALAAVRQGAPTPIGQVLDNLKAKVKPNLEEAGRKELHSLFIEPPWQRKVTANELVVLTIECAIPVSQGVLSEEEHRLADGVLVKAKANPGKSLPLNLKRFYRPNKQLLLGKYLHGSESDSRDALLEMTKVWWTNQEVVEIGYALIKARPEEAGGAIRTIAKSDQQILTTLITLMSPEAADFFLEALTKKLHRKLAHEWLERHPEYALRSWLPHAFGRKKKLRDLAENGLLYLVKLHGEAPLRSLFDELGPEVTAAVDELLKRDPLVVELKKVPKTISFLNIDSLPRPKLIDRNLVLPPEAVENLVKVLAVSPLGEESAGLAIVKQQLDKSSLVEFVWALFEQWLQYGAPSRESWALTALGLFGNDELAGRLTPMIRAWPGASQHKRAVMGLDVLLAIGTDVALMHLNGIAQKVKFKGIKTEAQERIAKLAETLGLTKDELADRLVPALGLEPDGTLPLNYGPRQFTVGFDEALKPFVLDGDGKRRKALPKPGARDDKALAEPAEAQFKLLKKNVRALAKIQINRLEVAMIVGRRWSFADFEAYLVRHPLLIHLVRRLIWGIYEQNRFVQAFRVTEDSTLADAEDNDVSWPPSGQVGVIHPIELPEGESENWGEILSDYELLQPFAQLGRPVHRLTEKEKEAKVLVRHQGTKIPIGRVLGLLNRGWERGEAQDGGVVSWLDLPLPDGTHAVRFELGDAGLWTGMVAEQEEDPSVDQLLVVNRNDDDWQPKGCMAFGTLPESLTSELIDNLENLVVPL